MGHFSTVCESDALWTVVARSALLGDARCRSLISIELAYTSLGADLVAQWRAPTAGRNAVRKFNLAGRELLRKRPRLKPHRLQSK
jgi:hypothetical protein